MIFKLFSRIEVFSAKIYLVILFAITFLAFSNTFNNQFIWDDQDLIQENHLIKNFETPLMFFSPDYWKNYQSPQGARYMPLRTLSFALDYKLWHDKVFGYHLTNFLLHLLNVFLVYMLSFILTKNKLASFISGVFFAVHPVHVESVTWIKNRTDLITGIFYLSGVIFFAKGRMVFDCIFKFAQKWLGLFGEKLQKFARWNEYYHIAVVALLYILALMSKEMAFTFPAVVATYIVLCQNKGDNLVQELKTAFKNTTWLWIISCLYLLFKWWLSTFSQKMIYDVPTPNIAQNILIVIQTTVFYLKMLVLPYPLQAVREIVFPNGIFQIDVLAPIIILAAFLWFLFWLYRNKKFDLLFLLGWIVITIMPVSNIFYISTRPLAEQRLYLPSVGYCVFLGWLYLFLMNLINCGKMKKPLNIIYVLIFIIFLFITLSRNIIWRDSVTFWTKTVSQAQASSTAHLNLGYAYLKIGQKAVAQKEFSEAIRIKPSNALALNNIGNQFKLSGKVDEAIAYYEKALQTGRNAPVIWNNLANAYEQRGDVKKAEELFLDALKKFPNFAPTYFYFSRFLKTKGELKTAFEYAERSVVIDPTQPYLYNNLGAMASELGFANKAVEYYNKALELDPNDSQANYNLGIEYDMSGDYEKAREYYEKSEFLGYKLKELYNNLGVIYSRSNLFDQAIVMLQKAIDLDKNYAPSYENMGRVYEATRYIEKAAEYYNIVLKLEPKNEFVLNKIKEINKQKKTQK